MKTLKVIGESLMVAGIAIAIATKDGIDYELAYRASGVALLFIGGLMAKAFDFQKGDAK